LAGSKFRAATLETFSDVYDFLQAKITNDDSYRRRRRRQTRSDIQLSTNFNQEVRNGLQNKRRLTSPGQANTYPLNNTAKRLSNETLLNS